MTRIVARDSAIADATSRGSPPTSVTSDASIATSAPVPMATPRSARASAGASLMPSPTIATRPPLGLQPLRSSRPCRPGSTSAITRSGGDADGAGDGLGGRPRVAGQQPDLDARPRAAPGRPRRTPACTGSAIAITPAAAPSTATNDDGPAVRSGGRSPASTSAATSTPRSRHAAAGCRPTTVRPADASRDAASDDGLEPVDRLEAELVASRAAPDDRLARGCSRPRSSEAARSSTLGLVEPGRDGDVDDLGPAERSACRSCRRRRCRPRPAASSASPPRTRIPASAPLARSRP